MDISIFWFEAVAEGREKPERNVASEGSRSSSVPFCINSEFDITAEFGVWGDIGDLIGVVAFVSTKRESTSCKPPFKNATLKQSYLRNLLRVCNKDVDNWPFVLDASYTKIFVGINFKSRFFVSGGKAEELMTWAMS